MESAINHSASGVKNILKMAVNIGVGVTAATIRMARRITGTTPPPANRGFDSGFDDGFG